jgi:hypothetical protein
MTLTKMMKARKASATDASEAHVTALVDHPGIDRHNESVALFSHGKPAPDAVPALKIDWPAIYCALGKRMPGRIAFSGPGRVVPGVFVMITDRLCRMAGPARQWEVLGLMGSVPRSSLRSQSRPTGTVFAAAPERRPPPTQPTAA